MLKIRALTKRYAGTLSVDRASFHIRPIHDDLAAFQSRIGYVPEEPYLYPYLSAYEYLELTGRLRGMPADAIEYKIAEACAPWSRSLQATLRPSAGSSRSCPSSSPLPADR